MKKELKVLFIEDFEDDAMLIKIELQKGGYKVSSVRIDNEIDLENSLSIGNWDIVISDYVLPQFSGIGAIKRVRQLNPDIPCIMISGKAGEETAVEAMKAGASDFLIKGKLSRLLPVVEREIKEYSIRKEKKAIELQLTEKEKQYQKLFESANDAIIILDDNKIIDCNEQTGKLFITSKKLLIGRDPFVISPIKQMDGSFSKESGEKKINDALKGIPQHFEWVHCKSDGTIFHTDISLNMLIINEKKMLMGVIRDITERKKAVQNQKLAIDILEILNHPGDQFKLIEKILHIVKDSTGIEAIGIRLKEGDDYPFFVSSGFPENFIELNSSLCKNEKDFFNKNDCNDKPILDCLCGSIICGLKNQSNPLFSEGGSFVMGTLDDFSKNKNNIKLAGSYRGYCMAEGYQSIALIPLKNGKEIIGILQFNDHQKNRFSKESITFFEGIASSIGIAIKRIKDEAEIRHNQSRINSLFEQNNDIIFTLDNKETFTSINPIGEKLITGKFVPGITIKSFLPIRSYRKLQSIFMETMNLEKKYCSAEIDMIAKNGSLLTFRVNFSLTHHNNELTEIFGIARNITTDNMLQNQVLSKIIETEEREKKSFAEELHDGLGSLLSTINIYIGLLQKKEKTSDEKNSYLKELNKLVHEAIDNVRMYANSLTPNVLNDFGLRTAIKLYCEKINTTRPDFIQINVPARLLQVDKIVEINIYRILMELINNSIKYSGAKQIQIHLNSEGKNLLMKYIDNGKGFSVEQALSSSVSGMGVKNVFARVKSLNGTCDFESDPGKGVHVSIIVPRKMITN
jgi:PAS domain S-box-containing protein